jgi:hypothetical protein
MTSLRQIEANRCNASKSTGPRTEAGKLRSRRNAIRHGLSAATVIEVVEDIDDYKTFETAIVAEYAVRTTVEHELALRLASLLWRLRRATAIETGLLRIQAEILDERRYGSLRIHSGDGRGSQYDARRDIDPETEIDEAKQTSGNQRHASCETISLASSARDLALCFQRLANLDSSVFERLGRYEAALGRQVLQCMFFLKSARCN